MVPTCTVQSECYTSVSTMYREVLNISESKLLQHECIFHTGKMHSMGGKRTMKIKLKTLGQQNCNSTLYNLYQVQKWNSMLAYRFDNYTTLCKIKCK